MSTHHHHPARRGARPRVWPPRPSLGAGGLALAPPAHAGSPEGSNRGHQICPARARSAARPVRVTVHDDDFAAVLRQGQGRRRQGASPSATGSRAARSRGAVKVGGTRAVGHRHRDEGRQAHPGALLADDRRATPTSPTAPGPRLRTRLEVTVGGRTAPLTCGQAYAFDTTTVTRLTARLGSLRQPGAQLGAADPLPDLGELRLASLAAGLLAGVQDAVGEGRLSPRRGRRPGDPAQVDAQHRASPVARRAPG